MTQAHPMLSTLWPAFIAMGYWILSFIIFSTKTWLKGLPVDAEVMGRTSSPVLGRFLRHFIMWLLAPWQRLIVRSGVTPNQLTFASLLAALGSGIAASQGRFALAGWLYFLCGILDILDGRVARINQKVTPAGAFFDSVIDRYAELFVFGGMAVFYRDSWALVAVLAASLGSVMVSYARARGESLGVTNLNIGMMQRPERLFYLGMSMIWSPIVEGLVGHGPFPAHALVVGGLLVLAVSTNLTAIRRIRHTMARLDAGTPTGSPAPKTESRATSAANSNVSIVPAPSLMPLRAAESR